MKKILVFMVFGFVSVLFAADNKPLPTVSGFVSAGYVQTGDNLDYSKGHFGVHQSEIGVDFKIVDNVNVYIEPTIVPYGKESFDMLLNEANISFANVKDIVDVKVGRFDIPFSVFNDYKDANNNSLITRPVGVMLGMDEGIALSKKISKLDMVVALMNGSNFYSLNNSKAVSWKASLSFSRVSFGVGALFNGATSSTAVQMGEANIASANGLENVTALEANAKVNITNNWSAVLAYNKVDISDKVGSQDRTVNTWILENVYNLTSSVAVVGRYSFTDCSKGYSLGSGSFLGSNRYVYGNSVENLTRISAGLNYSYNDYVTFKVEAGNDNFQAIPGVADTDTGTSYGIFDVVVSF